MQWLPIFKVVNPLSLLTGNFYIVSISAKIDMDLVTTGHGDINAKENINFDLYKSDNGQEQYSIPLLTGPAKVGRKPLRN